MGAGHAHPLYRPGDSPVHRLPSEVKIVAAFLGVLCVVATPREAFAVFGGYLLLLAAVWVAGRHPAGLDRPPGADRGAVRGARRAAAVHRG